ncbi:MAG: phytanoyl-CoA dioxygenase family protein [Candidatus Latescibacterota bacterium]|nr:phytanoyl-CoA dioxygenase family protein [Candidatus Latescibacterota bacterium]
MLTDLEINRYNDQGYIGVEKVLSSEEVESLRDVVDELVEQSREITVNDDVFDLEPDHTSESPKVRRIKSPITVHPIFDQTIRHSGILDVVAQLIGPNIRTNGNKLNMKLGEVGSAVEWHQDWSFYPHTNDDILAVGVCLDDMTEDNGCLLVVPESQKGPILDHHLDGRFAGAVTDESFDDGGAKKVELPAGGMSIHHVRALHGSLPNTSSNPRRLLLFQYCAGDAWPLMGVDWEGFTSSFLRGQPSNQPRVTEVPVRIPLPGSKRTGSIYETQTILERSTFSSTV